MGGVAGSEVVMRKGESARRRRGSVMIMVVTLLVLLALMGTAWIATVRSDRGASLANQSNHHADLMLSGLRNMAAAVVGVEDLTGYELAANPAVEVRYWRPRSDSQRRYLYVPWDCPVPDPSQSEVALQHAKDWLASRVPEISNNDVYWPAISAPLAPNFSATDPAPGLWESASWFTCPLTGVRYRQRMNLVITSVTVNAGGAPVEMPALRLSNGQVVLAADTDNDGIADAGLWRLPLEQRNAIFGQMDNVTWFAAARIVDNNSAINAATAWDWSAEGVELPANFFPSNISLRGVLLGTPAQIDAQMDALNRYRFNSAAPTASLLPYADTGVLVAAPNNFTFVSQQEAFWSQLGRRLDWPGNNIGSAKYRAVGFSEQLTTAWRFIMRDPGFGTELDKWLNISMGGPTQKYAPSQAGLWYAQNFDYPSGAWNVRPLLVTRNPVSNYMSPASLTGPAYPQGNPPVRAQAPAQFQPFDVYERVPVKASLNTASFEELWRAWWNVMADRPGDLNSGANFDTTPFWRQIQKAPEAITKPYQGQELDPANTAAHPARMFRSSIRDPRSGDAQVFIPPGQQLLLRAAIAAANTIQMRDPNRWTNPRYLKRDVTIQASVNGTVKNVTASIYPVRPQPYISEIYVNTDTTEHDTGNGKQQNKKGYIAIEIFNPHPFAIDLGGWQIWAVSRSGNNPYPLQVETVGTLPGNLSLGAGAYAVIENFKEGGNDQNAAHYRPTSVNGGDITMSIYVRDLYKLIEKLSNNVNGREMVLMRPAGGGGNDMVPVDSFDFTGLTVETVGDPPDPNFEARFWHYARETRTPWRCVYPGRYVGNLNSKRHQGIDEKKWKPVAVPPNPGEPEPAPDVPLSLGKESPRSSYPSSEFTIQLANTAGASNGGADLNALPARKFPFGGFARTGDVLQVPFISAYVIRDGQSLLEINAVTMDSVSAEDTDVNDDGSENIGRCCPVWERPRSASGPITPANLRARDWSDDPDNWRYRWAMKVFDYFTVLAPHDDYLPNAPKDWAPDASRIPVANADPTVYGANSEAERTLGVNGLVNINTAPWKVLAQVPMLRADWSRNPPDRSANERLAQAIVRFRDVTADGTNPPGNGPFKTLFDLLLVPEVLGQVNAILTGGADPDDVDGDITPLNSSNALTDGVRGDFEEQFLIITRISNLVTTRSDTFTAYLLIQGWRNAGSSAAELVAQRRLGIVIDRTGVTADRRDVKVTAFPLQ